MEVKMKKKVEEKLCMNGAVLRKHQPRNALQFPRKEIITIVTTGNHYNSINRDDWTNKNLENTM